MAGNATEQVLKTGMKAYLRLTTWVAGRDNSIGGMWSRLLEETKREMAESKVSDGTASPRTAGSDRGDAAASRAVEHAAAPRALTHQPSGGLENVERPPLHVSSLQVDHAADAATPPQRAATASKSKTSPTDSTPGTGTSTGPSVGTSVASPASRPSTTNASDASDKQEAKAKASEAGASLSGAGDVATAATSPSASPWMADKSVPTAPTPKSSE